MLGLFRKNPSGHDGHGKKGNHNHHPHSSHNGASTLKAAAMPTRILPRLNGNGPTETKEARFLIRKDQCPEGTKSVEILFDANEGPVSERAAVKGDELNMANSDRIPFTYNQADGSWHLTLKFRERQQQTHYILFFDGRAVDDPQASGHSGGKMGEESRRSFRGLRN